MNKLLNTFLILFVLSLAPVSVFAVTLSLTPSTQDIGVSGVAAVDLTVSGLTDGGAPSLGAFLVEIVFDDSVLSFDSVVYGPSLGDPDPLAFEADILTTTGFGLVSLDEVSFLFDFELDVLQSDAFPLATLTFIGDAAGMSALSFGVVDLADAVFPSSTIVPAALTGASITVTRPGGGSVPAPGGISLLLLGLLGFRAVRRFRPKSRF